MRQRVPLRLDVRRKVGRQLRAFREQQGLTLQEVAQKAGFTKGSLSKIEHGKVNLPLDTLARLARALEVPLRDCFPEESVRVYEVPERPKKAARGAA